MFATLKSLYKTQICIVKIQLINVKEILKNSNFEFIFYNVTNGTFVAL